MKITFVLPYAGLTGGNLVVGIYAQELEKRGHQVTVVSQPGQQLSLRQKLSHLRKTRRWYRPPPTLDLSHLGERHIVMPKAGQAPTDADLPDADFVVATWWKTAEWVQALGPAKGEKVYLLQDYEMFPHLPQDRVAETFNYGFLNIAVSGYISGILQEKHGVQDIAVISNAVDHTRFRANPRPKSDPLTIGFLYQTAPRKNIALALEVIEAARARYPELKVVTFSTKKPAPELPLPAGTEFHLLPAQDEIPKLYASCDLWLFTSETEGFGLPILEAMACRTPVIATRAGAAPDLIVDGENGYLVDPKPEAFLERIAQVSEMDEPRWQALSGAAQDTAHGWTWADAAEALEALLERNRANP